MRKLLFTGILLFPALLFSQTAMINIEGRNKTSLNGYWKTIIDVFDSGSGDWTAYYKDRKPQTNTDFVEYSFDLGASLSVPGDFNSQMPELYYYESSVWYKKTFTCHPTSNKRLFIHFGAVNYKSEVYLNGQKLGEHEGGFTPFQFELTGKVKDGENSLIVKANNQRVKDGIPGMGFDWFNYGGITRDVDLIETPGTYVKDYFIQLNPNDATSVEGYVALDGDQKLQKITVSIPELNVNYKTQTGPDGIAKVKFKLNKARLWEPENPKRYQVQLIAETDRISEDIGFRTIQTKGTEILLNGKPVFLKGVNIHEEIPQRKSRAYSESDDRILLDWAAELGCNYVRLVHYPHNEKMVKLAEKMGLMVWEEIPVYQHIDFTDSKMKAKIDLMLKEMIHRDKNRASVIIWSLSNETYSSPARNAAITHMYHTAKSLDNTRLITSAFNNMRFDGSKAYIEDELNELMDVMAINEYIGWYKTWPEGRGNMEWISNFNKPLIISEFGGEALYGNEGNPQVASTWSEDYLAQIYKDQFEMFKKIPFLRGVTPWVLVDYRSLGRAHPIYQQGWNRKGLLSDRGDKKKAWYVVADSYANIGN